MDASSPAVAGGKRKRTGRERAIAKAAAIAARETSTAEGSSAITSGSSKRRGKKQHREDDETFEDQSVAGPSHMVDDDDEAYAPEPETGDEDEGEAYQGEEEQPEEEEERAVEEIDLDKPGAIKSLHATFKKVRATETQRLIKKLRFLRTKEGTKEECADLEVQLESIKKLDLNTLLPRLVLQRLRKHPLTKPKLPLPDDLVPQLPAATISEGLSRVENRLASSKIAAEALTQAVAWIVGAEGGRLGGVQVRNKQQSKAMKQTPSTGKQASTATASPAAAAPRATGVPAQRVPVSTGLGDEDEAAAADAAGWESGSVRGGSDDESDDDDDDDDEDGDDSDDSGAILSDQEDIPPPPSKKAKLAPPPAPKPGVPVKSSMFLPSLAVGYTAGGSDDDFDPSDDERRASKSGRGVATERKNRRGQQERRKIWEAKYGRGANHLKQEKELEKAKKFMPAQGQGEAKPDSGWGGRAASSKPTKYRFGKRAEKDAAQAPAAAAPPPVPALPAPVKTGPPSGKAGASHPSWEAARLRKQKEMAAASAALGAPGAVKPKKIVFD